MLMEFMRMWEEEPWLLLLAVVLGVATTGATLMCLEFLNKVGA